MASRVKTLIYEKDGVELEYQEEYPLDAEGLYFDPSNTDLVATDLQAAVEEVADQVGVSASPGFSWGRSGNLSSNTWLQNDGVVSNRAGRTVNLVDPFITAVSIANEDINTFDITFYEHDGDSINLTVIGAVSVTNARSVNAFVNLPVSQGKQLAVRITSGSAKNVVVGLQLSGTVA
jgi:hypothetical protein